MEAWEREDVLRLGSWVQRETRGRGRQGRGCWAERRPGSDEGLEDRTGAGRRGRAGEKAGQLRPSTGAGEGGEVERETPGGNQTHRHMLKQKDERRGRGRVTQILTAMRKEERGAQSEMEGYALDHGPGLAALALWLQFPHSSPLPPAMPWTLTPQCNSCGDLCVYLHVRICVNACGRTHPIGRGTRVSPSLVPGSCQSPW